MKVVASIAAVVAGEPGGLAVSAAGAQLILSSVLVIVTAALHPDPEVPAQQERGT